MSKSLFSEFEPITAKAWKQKIQADLKGADYNDTLIWQTNDDIQVKLVTSVSLPNIFVACFIAFSGKVK